VHTRSEGHLNSKYLLFFLSATPEVNFSALFIILNNIPSVYDIIYGNIYKKPIITVFRGKNQSEICINKMLEEASTLNYIYMIQLILLTLFNCNTFALKSLVHHISKPSP
jgi:hypothetical protein